MLSPNGQVKINLLCCKVSIENFKCILSSNINVGRHQFRSSRWQFCPQAFWMKHYYMKLNLLKLLELDFTEISNRITGNYSSERHWKRSENAVIRDMWLNLTLNQLKYSTVCRGSRTPDYFTTRWWERA